MKPRIPLFILLVAISLGMLACGLGTLFVPTSTPTVHPPTPTLPPPTPTLPPPTPIPPTITPIPPTPMPTPSVDSVMSYLIKQGFKTPDYTSCTLPPTEGSFECQELNNDQIHVDIIMYTSGSLNGVVQITAESPASKDEQQFLDNFVQYFYGDDIPAVLDNTIKLAEGLPDDTVTSDPIDGYSISVRNVEYIGNIIYIPAQ
jgi:hypothetical protein